MTEAVGDLEGRQEDTPRIKPLPTERWLTILVHGVGDQEPGTMIDAVAGGICSIEPDFRIDDEFAVVHLKDPAALKGRYPLYTKRGETPGRGSLLLGEVHWADLSRIQGGTYELIVGIYRLIFGLRFVSDQAALLPGFWAAALRRLLYLAILTMRGPLLAILTLGFVFCLPTTLKTITRLFPIPWAREGVDLGLWVYPVLAIGIVAVGLVLAVRSFRGLNRLGAFGSCLALVAVGAMILCHLSGCRDYVNRVFHGHLPASLEPAHYFAVCILLASIARGLAYLVLGAALPVYLLAVCFAGPDRRAAPTIAFVAATFQLLIWHIALAPMLLVVDVFYERINAGASHQLTTDWLTFVGARLLLVYLVVVASLMTWSRRVAWAKAQPGEGWPVSFPPRLIAGRLAHVALFFAASYFYCEI